MCDYVIAIVEYDIFYHRRSPITCKSMNIVRNVGLPDLKSFAIAQLNQIVIKAKQVHSSPRHVLETMPTLNITQISLDSKL